MCMVMVLDRLCIQFVMMLMDMLMVVVISVVLQEIRMVECSVWISCVSRLWLYLFCFSRCVDDGGVKCVVIFIVSGLVKGSNGFRNDISRIVSSSMFEGLENVCFICVFLGW